MADPLLPGKQVWDNALKQNLLLYPSEHVVRFIAGASKRIRPGSNALDIGFGSGQHLQLFLNYGYVAHGTEFLERAIERGHELLDDNPLAGNIIQGDLDHPTLKDNMFSLIIAWGVIPLKPFSEIHCSLDHIKRILEPGGECCLNFRTKENWFYGLGKEVEPNSFILDERAGVYDTTLYTFLDNNEAVALCIEAGLEIINFERVELWKNNATERHSWLNFWLRKIN